MRTPLLSATSPLQDFFSRYFKDRGLTCPSTPLLRRELARGEVLLLLDGFDEVRELKHRNLVVERVQDFYSRHRGAGNKFVLTSRVVGYREVRPTAEGLAEATLVDFDDEEIEAFVEKWTAAIEKAAAGETRPRAKRRAGSGRSCSLRARQSRGAVARGQPAATDHPGADEAARGDAAGAAGRALSDATSKPS